MLILFYTEQCPFCQKVLEKFKEKSIEYTGVISEYGSASRNILEKLGEKQQIPFLIDTSEGKWMFESDDIIEYANQK